MREFPFLMYTADDSDVMVNAILKDETIWFSQKGMAELFDVQIPAVSKHLKIILKMDNWKKTRLFPKWK